MKIPHRNPRISQLRCLQNDTYKCGIYSVYTLYQYYLGFFSHKKIKKEIPNNIDQKMKVEKSMYKG